MSDVDDNTARQLALLDEAGRKHELMPADTEVDSANAMRARARSQRERVLATLRAHPDGLTDDEGAELLGWDRDRLKFGKRRQELRMVQLVEDSGQRRDTPAGHPAIVWRAVQ